MLGCRMVSLLVLAAWSAAPALAARPTLSCDQASRCPAGLVSEIQTAVDAACPCDAATSAKRYAKCWKPVVRSFVGTLGKTGFPKACRKEVARVLGNTTCGRSGFVLCRKTRRNGAQVCAVTKARKCADVFPTGPGFRRCTDACEGQTAIPFPSTVELARADLAALEPDPGDGTLRFAPAPASLANVKVGTILVAGVSPSTPVGFLRAVLAVERNGDQLTLRTGQAPIQLAYAKLHVRTAHATPLATPSPISSTFAPLLDFGTMKDFNYVLFDGDGDTETTNDQVAIDGSIGGGFDYEFMLDVDWGDVTELPDVVSSCLDTLDNLLEGELPDCSIDSLLPEARVTFVVHPQVEADANVHGAALLAYEKEVPLAAQTLPPILVGPLVFVPKADIKANLSGGASGEFSTGVHGSALFETSVTVSSKQTNAPQFMEPVLQSSDFGPKETKVSLQAFAKVGVAASLNLLLFDVTGPYATAAPYAQIEASLLDTPCWNLHAGIDATLGVKITSPDLPVVGSVTLVDWQAPAVNPIDLSLGNGMCDEPPDAHDDPRPPGSGPDAIHLAMPTYTPWSRTYDAPVDGSAVFTLLNSTNFSDLERTIDDRFVRSGLGVTNLTKFDQLGNLTWARALALDDGTPLSPLRVRSASDASLWTVSSLQIVAPIVLMKIAQDGSVLEARSFDVPPEVCSPEVTALAADGRHGVYVVGRCSGDPRSFVLHATSGGSTFRLIGDIDSLRVNVVEPIGDDVFLAGHASEGSDAMYAFRIAADGTVVYSNRYDGCLEAQPGPIPSAAIVGSQGEVTIAGSAGAQHNGMLFRIRPDGQAGFATFPGFGLGAAGVFILDSLVELPTTGYVAGGSSVDTTGFDPEDIPSAALVGFDSVGNIQWAKRYTFGTTDAYTASGLTALRLSDDGGVVATTLLANALDPFGGMGRLWAFKPFAKDGSIDFVPEAVTVTPLGVANLVCSAMVASDRPVSVVAHDIPTRALTATSTPVTLAVDQQTTD